MHHCTIEVPCVKLYWVISVTEVWQIFSSCWIPSDLFLQDICIAALCISKVNPELHLKNWPYDDASFHLFIGTFKKTLMKLSQQNYPDDFQGLHCVGFVLETLEASDILVALPSFSFFLRSSNWAIGTCCQFPVLIYVKYIT